VVRVWEHTTPVPACGWWVVVVVVGRLEWGDKPEQLSFLECRNRKQLVPRSVSFLREEGGERKEGQGRSEAWGKGKKNTGQRVVGGV
jgi:hypothetical protein